MSGSPSGGSTGATPSGGGQAWIAIDVPRVLGRDTGITASTWTDVYEAPDKVKGIIKLFNVYSTAAKTQVVEARLVDNLSQNIMLFQATLNGDGESVRFIDEGGELVVESTWKLQIQCDDTSIDYIASGMEYREQQ